MSETLTSLGFTEVEDGDGDTDGTWQREFGPFTVEVKTLDWVWDSEKRDTVSTPLDPPTFRVYLPHQCDDWVIVGNDGYGEPVGEDQEKEMADFARDARLAQAALHEVRKAVLS